MTDQNKPDECPICLEPMIKGATLLTTDCGHKFHFSCIQATIKKGTPSCPICRGDVKQLREAFLQQQQSEQAKVAVRSYGEIPVSLPTSSVQQQQSAAPYGEIPSVQRPNCFGTIPSISNVNSAHAPTSLPMSSVSSQSSNPTPGAQLAFRQYASSFKYPADEPLDERAVALSRASMKTQQIEGVQPLKASFALEHDSIACNEGQTVFGLLSLQAPEAESKKDFVRQPLDIVCVVDRSGSMSGKKIKLLKHTLTFVTSQLTDSDRLSIIQFDSKAKINTGLVRATDKGRKLLEKEIDLLHAGGGTDIGRALVVAFELLARRTACNPITSVLLLTDGQDGTTLSNLSTISDWRPPSVSLHSFGFGRDHDARTLNALAESARGTFTYIEALEDVGPSFAATLGGLMSICAMEIEAKIECFREYSIEKMHTKFEHEIAEDKKSVLVKIPDLFHAESRDLLLELYVPRIDHASEEKPLFGTIAYTVPGHDDTTKVEPDIATLVRGEKTSDANLHVNSQRNRVVCSTALEMAAGFAENNSYEAARETLQAAIDTIEKSPSAGERLCVELIKDLKSSKSRMVDRRTADSGGYAQLRAQANQHQWQRQTTSATSAAYGYNVLQSETIAGYGSIPFS